MARIARASTSISRTIEKSFVTVSLTSASDLKSLEELASIRALLGLFCLLSVIDRSG